MIEDHLLWGSFVLTVHTCFNGSALKTDEALWQGGMNLNQGGDGGDAGYGNQGGDGGNTGYGGGQGQGTDAGYGGDGGTTGYGGGQGQGTDAGYGGQGGDGGYGGGDSGAPLRALPLPCP